MPAKYLVMKVEYLENCLFVDKAEIRGVYSSFEKSLHMMNHIIDEFREIFDISSSPDDWQLLEPDKDYGDALFCTGFKQKTEEGSWRFYMAKMFELPEDNDYYLSVR